MLEKTHYANGQAVYTFSGTTMTYYYKSGKQKAVGTFENDMMEGEWKFYRESGELQQIGNFLHHQKHGSWLRYNKDMEIEYNETFDNGKLV